MPDDRRRSSPPPDAPARAGPDAPERRRAPRRALDGEVAAVLESVTHGFLAVDADWRVTYANAAARRLSGLGDDASLVGRSHWDVWPETVGSPVEAHYRRAVAERRSVHFEHHYAARGVWHEVHAFPTEVGGLAIVYRDVTAEHAAAAARDRYAAALAARERELALILHTATDAVVRFDRAQRVTFANPAVERATGLPLAALLGRSPGELGVAPELVTRAERLLAKVLADPDGEPRLATFALETAAGVRWFEAQVMAETPGPDGRPAAVLVVARDATARVTAERRLERALEAAEAANRAKSDFLATMSHELRTPLNAIRGFTDLLAMGVYGPVTDDQKRTLDRIRRSEEHLLGLIGEVLDYARLEAGRVRYDHAPVRLATTADEVLGWMRSHAERAGLSLALEPCDAVAHADPQRVRQVLVNLLSNALKFTPRGGAVTVRCGRGPSRAGGAGVAWLTVADTGPGVAADARERVFEPFVQLGRTRRRPIAGVGLGLAISREYARGMGGDLTAEEAPGGGALFRLTLPALPAPQPPQAPSGEAATPDAPAR